MKFVFPVMVGLILLFVGIGIKLGGRKTSNQLYWIFFIPIILGITELVRLQIFNRMPNLVGTVLFIVAFLVICSAVVAGWLGWKKQMQRFFPDQKRPAGGAIAGALIGLYLSICFLAVMIMQHPKNETIFKFPLISGLYVEIDASQKPFGFIHGILEDTLSPGGQSSASGSGSDSNGDSGQYPYATPDTVQTGPDQGQADLPVWAQDPPDQHNNEGNPPSMPPDLWDPRHFVQDSTKFMPVTRQMLIEQGQIKDNTTVNKKSSGYNSNTGAQIDPAELVPRESSEKVTPRK